MPTRSIALRLDLSNAVHCDALWTTHRLVNEKARWFVEQLLILRGDEVWTADQELANALGFGGGTPNGHGLFEVKAERVQERLGARIRLLCPGLKPEELEDASLDLRRLYDFIVPTHRTGGNVGEAGAKAQNLASHWASPLIDAASKGKPKATRPPAWLKAAMEGDEKGVQRARSWLCKQQESEEPAFAFLKEVDPEDGLGWLEELEAGFGCDELVEDLRRRGLLPVFPEYPAIAHRLSAGRKGKQNCLCPWDRIAFKLALVRLLSWESWNHRARKEHAARKAAFEAAELELSGCASAVKLLRRYERERTEALKAMNLLVQEKGDADFRLGSRQIRSWERLADRLRRLPSSADLRTVAGDFQTEFPRESPDPYFSEWVLARPEGRILWETDEGVRTVNLLAKANRLEGRRDRSRERTAMTPPDARRHPVWLQFEEPSGSNLKNLNLRCRQDGGWCAQLALIRADGERWREDPVEIPIRPSAQLALQKLEYCDKKDWTKPGKTPVLTFVQAPSAARVEDRAAFETWRGSMQSPDILFDRAQLERHLEQAVEMDGLRADLKLVLDLEPQMVEGQGIYQEAKTGWRRSEAPKWAFHLLTSLAETSKHVDALAEGQRFLSVDLGVRDLAAVALFEIRRGEVGAAERGFPIPASGDWKAVLVKGSDRILSLPGEEGVASPAERTARRQEEDALRLLKHLKRRRTRLLMLAHPAANSADRKRALEALKSDPKDPSARVRAEAERGRYTQALNRLLADDAPPTARGDRAKGAKRATAASDVNRKHHAVLRQVAGLEALPDVSRLGEAEATLQVWDEAINELVRVWRNRTRRRDAGQGHLHGKSLWSVEHLSEVRDFLKGWNRRGQVSGEINRPGRDFAKTLLDHINRIKKDRIKEGANLLVNTARGLVYDAASHRWEKVFPSAHLLLFENLERYRFLTDRTPAENSQLMRWAHRELTKVAAEMAQLFGIGVADTGAAFSSQYCGWTGAPGLRARTFTDDELESSWFKARWKGDWTPVSGELVPWKGGKTFCTLGADGLMERDADLNAAFSLARRFAMRHGEPFRLVCRCVGEDYVPLRLGKRQLGGLRDPQNPKDKGHGWLRQESKGLFRWEPLAQKSWEQKLGASSQSEETDEVGDDQEAIEKAQETAALESDSLETASHRPVVFFRDPSGRFFPDDRWVPARDFWGKVHQEIGSALALRHQGCLSF